MVLVLFVMALGRGVWGGSLGVGWGNTPKSPPRVGLGCGVAPWGLAFKPGVGRYDEASWLILIGSPATSGGCFKILNFKIQTGPPHPPIFYNRHPGPPKALYT
ncbi:hypothetical protein Hdeb2414_s0437g00893451 [Helianthus debilis subsp. tardiflorus]